ncbi:PleD family two-component system response regulator [Chroococcus sp. FPU101]|uniref:response regulator n=1 Tax=Chroococcus sp. FPU101 TaxID=1974212 RepID=UPI001A8ED269|nr:response regulator [Chroococcus sp. FPU101]GFE69189.1 response regulator receiver protein [Chroococcus sp. FPU101]
MKSILVVEDTQAERLLISALLTHAGFTVSVTDSSESAWEWLHNNPQPDLILLDIIMPGESGLDLCRKIRAHENWQNLPILFCSSKAEDFDRFWALRQGGNDYITKPFVPQQLVDTVERYVN